MCLFSHSMARIDFQVVEYEFVHRRSEEFERLMWLVRVKQSGVLRLTSESAVKVRLVNIAEVRSVITTTILIINGAGRGEFPLSREFPSLDIQSP